MLKSLDELQPPFASTADAFTPDIDDTTSLAGEAERVLDPLVTCAFVPGAGRDIVVMGFADVLLEEEVAVEGVEGDFLTATEHDVACDVVDACAFYGAATACVGKLADELETVEVPEDHSAIVGGGQKSGEGFGDCEDVDRCFVAEEGGAWC